MPQTDSTPRWRRSAWVAGALALTLGVSACSHLNNSCNCSTDANTSTLANAAAPAPRTPLVTRPIAYSQMQVAPPVAPPVPTGTVLYPWRLDPLPPPANTANPVVNPAELPRLAPPAPPAPPPPSVAAPLAQPAAAPAAAPRATVQRRPTAARKPQVTRSSKATKPQRAKRPIRTARATKATPPPRATTQRRTPAHTSATPPAKPTARLPNQPLDCANLWRTNPYLAKQLRCPAAAAGQAAPAAMGWPTTPAMGTASPAAAATYPTGPTQPMVQPTWLPGTGVPSAPPPTQPAR